LSPKNKPVSKRQFGIAPSSKYERFIPTSTLVFRRPSFIDLGGFSDRNTDCDAELVFRAFAEGRPFAIAHVILADSSELSNPPLLDAPPEYEFRDGRLSHYGRGFASSSVACDMVLPFYGHFDYVEEALHGALGQDNADVVIHLVDDHSPEDASKLLKKWSTHPQVRTYRNTENIGQFASFNNVIPFVETELVAVQDADDISLPCRICTAGNLLRLADADIFGGRIELFGDQWVLPPTNQITTGQKKVHRKEYRLSVYPAAACVSYYLENPTMVMRTETFRSLGGFADFGERIRNRTGLDAEFLLRALYAGTRVAVTRQRVLRYRVHGDSATQNDLSGWGTPARKASQIENRKRAILFRRGRFDPRVFGALNSHRGVTKRIHSNKTIG
jgi:GT2 family glycosyltransferase